MVLLLVLVWLSRWLWLLYLKCVVWLVLLVMLLGRLLLLV